MVFSHVTLIVRTTLLKMEEIERPGTVNQNVHNWRFYNVVILGISFMLMFTAFQTSSMIEQTVLEGAKNETNFTGNGYTSLAVIYGTFAAANWLSPSVVAVCGAKISMFIGGIFYTLFITSFLKPMTWSLYLGSVIVGIGAAIIWTGQGTFLTLNSDASTIGRNSGIFWALLQCRLKFEQIMPSVHILWVFGKETFLYFLDIAIQLDTLPSFLILGSCYEFEVESLSVVQSFMSKLPDSLKCNVIHIPPETIAPPPSPSRKRQSPKYLRSRGDTWKAFANDLQWATEFCNSVERKLASDRYATSSTERRLVTSEPTPAIASITSEPSDKREPVTSEPTDEIRPVTSEPGDEIGPVTPEPGDEIGPVTSEPGDEIGPVTSEPGDEIGSVTPEPGDEIGPVTSEPGDEIGPVTSEPGDEIGSVTPEPGDETGPVTSEPGDEIGSVTPEPGDEIGPVTSEPGDEIGPVTSETADEIEPVTSEPGGEIGPVTSEPGDEIGPVTPEPGDEIGPVTPEPGDEIGPVTSEPGDEIGSVTSEPGDEIGPVTSEPGDEIGPVTPEPGDKIGPVTSETILEPTEFGPVTNTEGKGVASDVCGLIQAENRSKNDKIESQPGKRGVKRFKKNKHDKFKKSKKRSTQHYDLIEQKPLDSSDRENVLQERSTQGNSHRQISSEEPSAERGLEPSEHSAESKGVAPDVCGLIQAGNGSENNTFESLPGKSGLRRVNRFKKTKHDQFKKSKKRSAQHNDHIEQKPLDSSDSENVLQERSTQGNSHRQISSEEPSAERGLEPSEHSTESKGVARDVCRLIQAGNGSENNTIESLPGKSGLRRVKRFKKTKHDQFKKSKKRSAQHNDHIEQKPLDSSDRENVLQERSTQGNSHRQISSEEPSAERGLEPSEHSAESKGVARDVCRLIQAGNGSENNTIESLPGKSGLRRVKRFKKTKHDQFKKSKKRSAQHNDHIKQKPLDSSDRENVLQERSTQGNSHRQISSEEPSAERGLEPSEHSAESKGVARDVCRLIQAGNGSENNTIESLPGKSGLRGVKRFKKNKHDQFKKSKKRSTQHNDQVEQKPLDSSDSENVLQERSTQGNSQISSDSTSESDHYENKHSRYGNQEKGTTQGAEQSWKRNAVSDDSEELLVYPRTNRRGTVISDSDTESYSEEMIALPQHHTESESDSTEDSVDEDEIARDIKYNEIFVRKVLKSATTVKGKKKKTTRVYNSHHYCPYCQNCYKSFAQHVLSHSQEDEVQEIYNISANKAKDTEEEATFNLQRKAKLNCLRRKADHQHNMRVLEDKKGELILGRRFVEGRFDLNNFGPCPNCLEWLRLTIIDRHQKNCPGVSKTSRRESKGILLMESSVMSGRIKEKASKALVREVLSIMQHDEVGKIARSDEIILSLGNNWLQRNQGNRLKRANYTSSIMRLSAKLLKALRAITKETLAMSQFLKPKYFDDIVSATLTCAAVEMDDDEELQTPSNAIKLGFEIKRMLALKKGIAIRKNDKDMKEECREFLELMEAEWSIKVTKLARNILTERWFNKDKQLPDPDDLKILCDHITQQLQEVDLRDVSAITYRRTVQLVQAKLVSYNRRRSGEIESMKLSSYVKRKQGTTKADMEITRKLTKWEEHLLNSQELVEIRGKNGRGVPVLLPSIVKEPLKFLTSAKNRESLGVKSNYIFASTRGTGVIRAYESLSAISSEANLKKPENITSVQLRKYMATVAQVLDMKDSELKWVLQHLGHTHDVHMNHYRARSDVIERLEVAKLCLIQDNKLVQKFHGKKLSEIQFSEIVYTDDITSADEQNQGTGDSPMLVSVNLEQDEEAKISDVSEDEIDESDYLVKKRKAPKTAIFRRNWIEKEEEELRQLFSEYFITGKCPGFKACEKAICESRKKKGLIHKIERDKIKKKVNNMIQKEKE